MVLTVILLTTATAWAQTVRSTFSGGSGSINDPYQIKTAADLVKLSDDVNSGTRYRGKYFKLMDDIDFSYTSDWNDITSTENNFTPIGFDHHDFEGTFDGNDKTISGIRINKTPYYSPSQNVGLFGGINGTVKKVTLTDTRIIGYNYAGGIVGDCKTNSTVDHCTVTSTVAIYAIQADAKDFGGIVGHAGSKSVTITNNTSSATIAIDNGLTGCERFGGIVGYVNPEATVSNNLAIGATVKDSSGLAGAIMGVIMEPDNIGADITNNYYINCTVNGTANALNVGCPDGDLTGNCAAVSLHTLTLADGVTTTTPPSVNIGGTDYYGYGTTITLSGMQTGTPPVGYIYGDGYSVNGTANSGNTFTMPAQDTEVTSTTVPVYTLTLADGITTTTTPDTTVGDTPYYLAGTTITLSTAQPATYIGYLNGDGYTVNGTAISGNTFPMPAQDTNVMPANTIPIYKLTLADGITATGTIAATYGDDNYYLAGTGITLSGGLPEVSAENEYAAYTVNGEEINGNNFTMPAEAVTVSADIFSVEWTGEGTESSPYLIKNSLQLKLLAQRVNNAVEDADGEPYSYKWYKLVADLQFDYADLGETESNFEAIANGAYQFYGHFLGNGHTISGIRIRQGNKNRQGLFGFTEYSEISGVILTDADITGKSFTGGIVGFNGVGGTVTDCHVTNTVIIRATADEVSYHGGIVGVNGYGGTVSGCTSAATLTVENGATNCRHYGGIAGYNDGGTLNDNMALGVHLPNINESGAIIGDGSGETMLRNYYNYCTKEGDDMVYGCHGMDITDNDGAVPGIALYDHSVFSCLNSRILQTVFDPGCNFTAYPSVALLGRTLYKDGNWNTLCLPFNVVSINNSPLADATMMELDEVDKWTMEDGQWIIDNENGTCQTGLDGTTLYLYFKPATRIDAGKLYIVKWETNTEGTKGTEDTEIKNPVFRGVEIRSTEPSNVISQDGKVQFRGIYDRKQLPKDDGSNLCFGDDSQLYWPAADEALNAFRAYFHVDGTVQAIQSNSLFALMGDVNGNGGIDIGDAVCIVNYLVNKNNTVFKDQLADLNGNGDIDIGDAVMIVNILVGKTGGSQTTGKGLQTTEEGLQTTDDHEPQ